MRGEKREQILRVLLAETMPLSKNELARRTKCSRQWIILFLKELEAKGLVKETRVVSVKKLIEYWLEIHEKSTKYRQYMIKEPLELLKKTQLDYALTTYTAENLVHHYLFPHRNDIYVKEEDIEKWHTLLMKDGLYGGGNVRIIPSNEHVFYKSKKIHDLFVVCLPQLIIDLFTENGVCGEAAEMLMEKLEHVQRV
jgi:DNA-binding Lrp family transcriptional regulator